MKKWFVLLILWTLSLPCQAQDIDPCGVNRWIMAINVGNSTSREGLLEVLTALSTYGVSIDRIGKSSSLAFSIVFEFSSGVFEPDQALQVKQDVLESLTAIYGVELYCDSLDGPES